MKNQKVYNIDMSSGELSLAGGKNKEVIAIFLYNRDESTDLIEGTCPLVFDNINAANKEYFKTADWKDHLESGFTVVIRKILTTK